MFDSLRIRTILSYKKHLLAYETILIVDLIIGHICFCENPMLQFLSMRSEIESSPNISTMSTKDIIKSFGGWNEGHYIFRTGEHGNGYIDKMGFLRYPEVMTEMGKRLAIQFLDIKNSIDIVVGPSIIGAILAYSTANYLKTPYTATYRTKNDNNLHFHRGFIPEKGTRCLFVDDFIFSGKDVIDNVTYIQNQGIDVVGVSIIGMRNKIVLPIPIKNLINVEFKKTLPDSCDMCKTGLSITAIDIRE